MNSLKKILELCIVKSIWILLINSGGKQRRYEKISNFFDFELKVQTVTKSYNFLQRSFCSVQGMAFKTK